MKKKTTTAPKLPPMQQMAMDLLERDGFVNPYQLQNEWAAFKGHRVRGSSRDNFGNNAAAYQCLYRLAALGHIRRESPRDPHNYNYIIAHATR